MEISKKPRRLIYLLSFFIPIVIMFGIFIARGIYPFGNECFLRMDLFHQYLPFLNEFKHAVQEGGSLLYSWRLGLGTNFIAFMAYYLATPTNWLSVLVSSDFLIEFITIITLLKTGLASLSFSHYLRKHFKVDNYGIVFFSVAYSMSAFFAAYSWNTMWIDCLILAPLIILGLEILVNEGRMSFYILTLGLCIYTNYYISIMICIFLVLYFVVLFISAPKKLRAIGQFTVSSLLSGLIGSIMLLPMVESMLSSEYAGGSIPQTLTAYFNMFQSFARHLMNVETETGLDDWPNIYCGVFILVLLFLYIFTKAVPLKEKIPKLLLGLFMMFSFCYNIPNYIWHGFNWPNSLPARQSFLYIILVLVMGYEAYIHIKETKLPWVIISGVLGLSIVGLAYLFGNDDAFTEWCFILSGVFILIYFVLLLIYKYSKTSRSIALIVFTSIFVITEFTTNMMVTSVPTTNRVNYMYEVVNYRAVASKLQELDPGFYRIEKYDKSTENDSMLSGYNSASFFSSVSNPLVKMFYDRYGLKNTKVYYSYKGATPLISALLNVKYVMDCEDLSADPLYTYIVGTEDTFGYELKYTLPLGFMIPTQENSNITSMKELYADASKRLYDAGNVISKQNTLAKKLGASVDLFESVNSLNTAQTSIIEVPEDGRIYVYITNYSVDEITVLCNGVEKKYDGYNSYTDPYILDLGYHEEGDIITISTEDISTTLNTIAYSFNEDEMYQLIQRLASDSLSVTSYTSTSLKGKINVSKDSDLFLSIPYDSNWQLYVDGVKTDYTAFEDAFISTHLTAGDHTIELRYVSVTVVVGLVLTLVAVGIWLTIFVYENKKRRELEESENNA